MAKHCSVCNRSFHDNLSVCPYCGAEASAVALGKSPTSKEEDSAVELVSEAEPVTAEPGSASDVVNIDWSAFDDPSSRKKSGEHTAKESPSGTDIIQLAEPVESAGDSDVVQLAEPVESPGESDVVDLTTPSSKAQGKEEATDASHGKGPGTLRESGGAAPVESEESRTMKMPGRSKPKTMLAQSEEMEEAGAQGGPPHRGQPTKRTMLAQPEEMDEAGAQGMPPPRGQPTKKTMMAQPEEMEEAGSEGTPPTPGQPTKKTQMAAPARSQTMLAQPEEMEAETSTPETQPPPGQPTKKTQMAAKSRPETMLAPPGEEVVEIDEDAPSGPPRRQGAPDVDEEVVQLEEPSEADQRPPIEPEAEDEVSLHGEPPEEFPSTGSKEPAMAETTALPSARRDSEVDWEATEALENAAADSGSGLKMAPEEEAVVEEGEAVEEEEEDSDRDRGGRRAAAEAKPAKGGGFGRLVGGGVVGLILGCAACFAAWVFGVAPEALRDKTRDMVGVKKPVAEQVVAPETKPPTPTTTTTTEQAPAEVGVQDVDRGDLAQAVSALDKVDKPTPDVQARRGEARWLAYWSEKSQKHEPLKATDEDLKKAKEDLTQAEADKNPLGTFWLGQIEEALGNYKEARTFYEQGLKNFPDQKPRFQAALDRLETNPKNSAGEKPAEGAQSRARSLALLLMAVALQNDQPEQPKADQAGAGLPEAGFDFWKAMSLARKQQYADAIAALTKAKNEHEQRRFLRLHKDQNPVSDPTEEIFLRGCDELLAYWQMREKLSSTSPELAKIADPIQALDALVKEKTAAADAVKAVADKLKNEKEAAAVDLDADLAKGLDLVLQGKKNAEKQSTAVKAALADAKYVSEDQPDALVGLKKLMADQQKDSTALAAARELLTPKYVTEADASVPDGVKNLLAENKATGDKLAKMSGQLDLDEGMLKDVTKKLVDAKYLEADAGRADLAQGLDRLIKEGSAPVVTALAKAAEDLSGLGRNTPTELAKSYNLAARLNSDEAQIIRYQALLMQSRKPQEMLDLWLALLQDRQRMDLADQAIRDAERVTKDGGADADSRAKALAVQGLALRNQGKFDEARMLMDQALNGASTPPPPKPGPKKAASLNFSADETAREPATAPVPAADTGEAKPAPKAEVKKDGGWRNSCRLALKELTDPAAYYLPEAQKLEAAGKHQEALNLLNTGLAVFPPTTREGGRLVGLRSLVYLNLARAGQARGKLPADNPQVKLAQEDADAALEVGAVAEGQYAAGRLAEEEGQWAKAQKSFQLALDTHPETDATGSRYRLALARVLIQLSDARPSAIPEPEPKPAEPEPQPVEPKPETKPAEPKPVEPKPETKPPEPKPVEPEPKPVEPKPVEPGPKPVEPKATMPKPAEPKPVEPKPDEAKPVEPKPVEPKPVEPEPKPVEPKPDLSTPVVPKPDEPKPIEPKPAKPKPDEAKPAEPKPVVPKPVEQEPKPDEPKPVEPKPIEPGPKPVEPKANMPKPVVPKPDETKPAEPTPVKPKPDVSKPAEPKPVEPEPKPDEAKPAEPKPVVPKPETKPVEPKPDEPKPVEPKPAEPKPDEPKPAEPKPDASKPAEPKPDVSKPVEPKPDEPKPVEPKPEKPAGDKDSKTGRLPVAGKSDRVAAIPPRFNLLMPVLSLVAAAPEPQDEMQPPPLTPELDKALELADKAIAAGDPAGHLVKAKILARKDQWNQALKEYVKGLQELVQPPEYVNGLRELVDNHPAFRLPDALKQPDPLLAEKHYSIGMHYYWNRNYPAAEEEFAQAVHNNDQDARFYYFLGLSELLQAGWRARARDDAYEAFQKGGERELQDRPSSAAVGAALERVQGSLRKTLDRESHRGGE